MNFNLESFTGLLKKKEFDTSAIKDNLILILGNTGAGKSSLEQLFLDNINLCTDEKTNEKYFALKDESIGPKIGLLNTGMSTTKLPDFYEYKHTFSEKNHLSVHFCDMPGFFNTDSLEENVLLALSIQYLMKTFKNFIAIFVVITLDDINSAQGHLLKELLKNLENMFYNIEEIKDSIYFIFNKTNNIDCVEKLRIMQNSGHDELKILNRILNFENRKNSCVVSYEDFENSKEKIFEFLKNHVKYAHHDIKKNILFNKWDSNITDFHLRLSNEIKEINEVFKKENEIKSKVENLKIEIKKKSDLNAQNESKKTKLESSTNNLNYDGLVQQIHDIDNNIKIYTERWENFKAQLLEAKSNLAIEEDELNSLDRDERT